MKSLFLKAKHWQIFTVIFLIPFVFQIILMSSIFVEISSGNEPDPIAIFSRMKLFPLVIILFMFAQFGWYYFVTIELQKLLPKDVKLKITRFKIFFFFPVIYLTTFLMVFIFLVETMITTATAPDISFFFGIFAFIVPLHFFAIFCIFHTMYFTAKTIKSVEEKKEINLEGCAIEFLLLWFFPIGIWFLQPRINKLYTEQEYNSKPSF